MSPMTILKKLCMAAKNGSLKILTKCKNVKNGQKLSLFDKMATYFVFNIVPKMVSEVV